MKNLFYSKADKILFWVAGYTADNNTDNVMKILDALVLKSREFRKYVKCRGKDVNTLFVTSSSKYKYMRVFYLKDISLSKIPNDAYQLGEDWTMEKWLKN